MAKTTPGVVVPEVRKALQAAVPADLKQQLKEIDTEGKKKKEALEADVKAGVPLGSGSEKQLKELRAEAKKKKEVLRAGVENRTQKALSGAKRVLMYSKRGVILCCGWGTVENKP